MKGKSNNDTLNGLTPKQKDCLAVDFAYFMIDNKSTMRKTAKRFKVSKSTVHKYIHTRLPRIDIVLYEKVMKLIKWNSEEKHKRGGEAKRLLSLMNKK